jgi:hypothetical protein
MVSLVDHTQLALFYRRLPVRPGLTEEENVLNVILYDRVRLVWLAKEGCTITVDLGRRIGNLVPEDGREIVEPKLATRQYDVGVKGNYVVSSDPSARQANVTDNDA